MQCSNQTLPNRIGDLPRDTLVLVIALRSGLWVARGGGQREQVNLEDSLESRKSKEKGK